MRMRSPATLRALASRLLFLQEALGTFERGVVEGIDIGQEATADIVGLERGLLELLELRVDRGGIGQLEDLSAEPDLVIDVRLCGRSGGCGDPRVRRGRDRRL